LRGTDRLQPRVLLSDLALEGSRGALKLQGGVESILEFPAALAKIRSLALESRNLLAVFLSDLFRLPTHGVTQQCDNGACVGSSRGARDEANGLRFGQKADTLDLDGVVHALRGLQLLGGNSIVTLGGFELGLQLVAVAGRRAS